MSNAIRFLETLGQNPGLPASELEALMASLEINEEEQATMLNGGTFMMSILREPGEDDQRSPEDAPQRDDEPQEEPEE